MSNATIGFAMCGSYCTFERAIAALERLCGAYGDIVPIMSENAYAKDTRFGRAETFHAQITELCGKEIIHTIEEAEPIGPRALLDVLVIAPCTGNTLSKIANGVTDTAVTMAAKAQLRNNRPVLIAISTNDALSGSAPALGALLARRNIFFVPFYQDDPAGKPTSLLARLELLNESVKAVIDGKQLQPIIDAT